MLYVHKRRDEIAKILKRGAVAAEVGVFTGSFSKMLCKRTMPASYYLIDPWWKLVGKPHRSKDVMRAAYNNTLEAMRWWLDRDIARVIMQQSQIALANLPDHHLDWAYLDSSHRYEETCEELRLLSVKVKQDGVICGHDFNTKRHPGVFRAVADFLRANPDYELFYMDNRSQWGVRRRAI